MLVLQSAPSIRTIRVLIFVDLPSMANPASIKAWSRVTVRSLYNMLRLPISVLLKLPQNKWTSLIAYFRPASLSSISVPWCTIQQIPPLYVVDVNHNSCGYTVFHRIRTGCRVYGNVSPDVRDHLHSGVKSIKPVYMRDYLYPCVETKYITIQKKTIV